MARIVGGIATSHTPTIGFAYDKQKQDDPVWKPIFEGYEPVQQWLADRQARRAVLHLQRSRHLVLLRSLFGLRARHRRGVSGGGRGRRRPRAAADPGRPGARAASRRGARGRRVRHVVLPGARARPRRLLAAVAADCRTSRSGPWRSCRCRWACCNSRSRRRRAATSSARSLRRAIESYPEDIKVAIVATGGLSHQVHGERAGFNNTEWDMEFMDLLEKDPEKLTRHHARRIRGARRARRRRGHHVADHARRAVGRCAGACTRPTTCRR